VIEDRNLKPGTKLVATYKKQDFTCEVVKTKDGVAYRLADGQEFKSLSSAGSAVMNGSACNGWRFWTVEGEAKPKASSAPAKALKAEQTIKPMKGAEGRFFCSACQDAFASEESDPACPQGHSNAAAEEAPKAPKKTPAKRKAKTKV
jgi:Restriction Enzyme Adenine Methylase Associated